MKRTVLTILMISTALLPVFAQTIVLTEDSAVERAIVENLSLAQGRVNLSTSARSADTAWNALLPSMNVSGTLARSNEEISTTDPYNTTFSARLEAQLVFSIASIEGISTARLQYINDQITYEQAVADVALAVRQSFYSLILAEQNITVAEQSVATAEETLVQTQTEFNAGLVSEVTLRQAEVTLRNRRLTLQRQEAAYDDALANFRLLLGIREEQVIELEGTIEVEALDGLDEIAGRTDLTGRWDLQDIDAQIATRRSVNRATTQLERTPTVTLGASYSPALADPFNADNPAGDEWNDQGSLSVTVTIPLDNYLPFSSTGVDLRGNDDILSALEIQRANVLDNARFEVDSLLRALQSSAVALESLELSLSLQEEIYLLTLDSYQQGVTDFIDVLEAADDLEEARYQLLSEQFTYLSTLLDLEYALNTTIRTSQ